jgi:hypothetical protein
MLTAFIAAVILPLHPIRGNIDIDRSTNGTHPQSPHYEIHVSLFNSISYSGFHFSCNFLTGISEDQTENADIKACKIWLIKNNSTYVPISEDK